MSGSLMHQGSVDAASASVGVKGVIFRLTAKLPETSVTRSLISGNVFIGRTVIGPSGSSSTRVLQSSTGRPLTSAEHEPHLAALQFQRTARSVSTCFWM